MLELLGSDPEQLQLQPDSDAAVTNSWKLPWQLKDRPLSAIGGQTPKAGLVPR